MMAIRHQYMTKMIRVHSGQDIYNFFKNKNVLILMWYEFLNNYCEMGAKCTGIDVRKTLKLK